MCEPASIMLAIGTAATVAKVGTDIASGIAQHNAQAEEHKQNEAAALQELKMNLRDIGIRQEQEQEAVAQTIMGADRQARQADALARVSAGEAGVTGASVDALLGSIERDRLEFENASKRNLSNTIDQLQREKDAAKAHADNRIKGVPDANPFVTGLRIGGAALDGAAQLASMRPK